MAILSSIERLPAYWRLKMNYCYGKCILFARLSFCSIIGGATVSMLSSHHIIISLALMILNSFKHLMGTVKLSHFKDQLKAIRNVVKMN